MKQRAKLFILSAIVLFLGISIPVFSQTPCNSVSEFPADDCSSTCIGCALNGFQGSNNGFSSTGATYCNGAMVDENSVWYAFIAGSSDITITVAQSGCSAPTGLQIALFSECNTDALACDPSTIGTSRTISSPLVIGVTYYLVVSGAICNYSIVVTPPSAALSPPLNTLGAITGPSNTCPDAERTFSVGSISNALQYEWTAPPGASINGTGSNIVVVPAQQNQNTQTVGIVFSQASGNVSVRALGVCEKVSNTVSKYVTVQPIPPTNLPMMTVYTDELPYIWQPSGETINNIGVFQFFTTHLSWQGCDSMIQQIIKVEPRLFGIVYWDINNNNIYNSSIDIPAEGVTVLSNNGQSADTDLSGKYQFDVIPLGSSYQPSPLPPNATSVVPSIRFYNGGSSNGFNFALKSEHEQISGRVYLDNDNDGTFGPIDQALSGYTIKTTSNKTAVTDANGLYTFADVAYPEQLILTNVPAFYQILSPTTLPFVPGGVPTNYDFRLGNNNAYGSVFWDINMDNILSAGDIPANGISLTLSNGSTAITNHTGNFNFTNSQPGDTIRVNAPGAIALPAFQVITSVIANGYSFLLQQNQASVNELAIDLTNNTVFRPGFNTSINIQVTNANQYAIDTKIGLKKPSFLTFFGATTLPNIQGDSLTWALGDLPPNSTKSIVVHFVTSTNTPISTPVLVVGTVRSALAEANLSNNTDQISTIVVGSYDPNDKQVAPPFATPDMLANTPPLEYIIRFQNTGNFPADQVEIIDSLPNTLQWATLRMVASSHPYTWTLSPEGVLKFLFANIQLPDMVSDEPGSHGFVKFTVQPIEGLMVGDKVDNFCDIYFDFNQPIRTNTAQMNVVLFLSGGNVPIETPELSVRPNPASYYLRFSWAEATPEPGTITLYNINGVPVLTQEVPMGSTGLQLNTEWLESGPYIATLQAGNRYYVKRVALVPMRNIRRE